VVAALPALSIGLSWPARLARLRPAVPVLVAAFSVLLALRVRTDAHYVDDRREHRTGLGWNAAVLPVEAAEFVARASLEGPMLNHLNLGGWLMWALDRPVFIDGRLEVVGEEFFLEYRRALDSQEALEACVARWGIRWMIFPYATFPRLLGRMSGDPRWTLVHADPVGVVFVRKPSGAAPPLDHELARVLAPDAQRLEDLPGFPDGPPRPSHFQRWIEGFHSRQRFPAREHHLALFHLYRGENDRAIARIAAAIRASDGRYLELYNNLGAALFRAQRWPEAERSYRIVLSEQPGDPLARQRLIEIESHSPAGGSLDVGARRSR
jgi:tetratricopeptide (TPR) repeat protein